MADELTVAEARKAYEISTDIQCLVNEIIENNGEISDGQLEQLNGLRLELADKAQSICHVRKQIEGNIEYWKAMKAIADEKIKAREKAVERLGEYLCKCMQQADIQSFKSDRAMFSVTVCKGKPSVVVDDVSALDVGYFEVVKKPVAKAIKEALEKGEEVAGAHLEMGKDYVMIRSSRVDK